ncbi:MAG: GNAT family N-acetyltransferase [Elusimicrobia bacterium]|nr:GNAT family N-acetyltransferase [Elusimicrobiota bacterium]
MIEISAATDADHDWARALLKERWTSARIVTRGRVHRADRLPAFVARLDGERAGLATYRLEGAECEIVSLDSTRERRGVASALVGAVRAEAARRGCRRLWLVTTNENVRAQRFYEGRGFALARVHRGAVEADRRLKPSIPKLGEGGVPIVDEHEYELALP